MGCVKSLLQMDYKKGQSYIGQSTTPHNWNVNVTEKKYSSL